MALARAEDIANHVDYGRPLALASDNYAELRQCVLDTYDAAHQCRSEWLASGEEKHLAAAQTLAIKAALLNGLYVMRLRHKEWRIDSPMISAQALRNVVPLFRHALGLCERQSQAVQFPVDGLHPALAYLEKQVEHSLHCLQAGQAAGSAAPWPDGAADHEAACRELGRIVRQLQAVLVDGPGSRRTDPAEGAQMATAPSSPGERSFKSVLISAAPAHPATASGKPAAHRAIQAGAPRSGPAPRHDPAHPEVRREPRPMPPSLETLRPQDRPAPSPKTRPHRPGTAANSAARPLTRQPAGRPALPETTQSGPLPMPAASPTGAAEQPADPAAEAAARLRQEQLAKLRGALAPLRDEARRRHDTAQASAGAPPGQPWASHASHFMAWQNAAQAYDACAEALTAHADALGLGRHPDVRDLQREFDAATGGALARATQAAEAALAVFLQTWQAALGRQGPAPAGMGNCADLAVLGRDLQQQWLEAPLRPQLPVLEARMAVFSACEAISAAQAAPDNALELLCQATAEARQACEGAKGELGKCLRTFRDACRSLRDNLLCKTVRREFEATDALLAESGRRLQPLLDHNRAIAAACHVLLAGDPLPAARLGEPELPAPPARRPAAMPEADQALIEMARELAATVRTRREQAIELPADAPARAVHEQQAARGALRQSEKAAESAAAVAISFHQLREALAQTPLDEQPSLVRSHARALWDIILDLNQLLQAQKDLRKNISDAQVGGLVERSCALLLHDLCPLQSMHVGLETLTKLLDARVSVNHACRRVMQGSLEEPRLDVVGVNHQAIADQMGRAMRGIEKFPGEDQHLLTAEAWEGEKRRLRQTADGLLLRIQCDSAMIQARYVLHAVTVVPPTPEMLCDPDAYKPLARMSRELWATLGEVNKNLKQQAASSAYKDGYQAQLDINEQVHQRLRALRQQLKVARANALATPPAAGTSAGSGGPAEEPAPQPSGPAAHESRPPASSSGSSRKSRTRRR